MRFASSVEFLQCQRINSAESSLAEFLSELLFFPGKNTHEHLNIPLGQVILFGDTS